MNIFNLKFFAISMISNLFVQILVTENFFFELIYTKEEISQFYDKERKMSNMQNWLFGNHDSEQISTNNSSIV